MNELITPGLSQLPALPIEDVKQTVEILEMEQGMESTLEELKKEAYPPVEITEDKE